MSVIWRPIEGRLDLFNSLKEKIHSVGDSFLFHQLHVGPLCLSPVGVMWWWLFGGKQMR